MFCFSLFQFMYIFLLVYDIFVDIVPQGRKYVFVWISFAGGGLGLHVFSPFTHSPYILYMNMSAALYPGLSSLELEGDCVAVPQWMYFPSGHCENPIQSLFASFDTLTSCCLPTVVRNVVKWAITLVTFYPQDIGDYPGEHIYIP